MRTLQSAEKVKITRKNCGKTLMFMKPSDSEDSDCVTIEIKCRNRECKALNEIKICHKIC